MSQPQQIAPFLAPAARLAGRSHREVRGRGPRDFLVTATPGAGKTAFALRWPPGCWPPRRSTADRSSARPITCARNGPTPRPRSASCSTRPAQRPDRCATAHGYVTTYAQVAGRPACSRRPRQRRQHAGHPRRGAPRRRRAVCGVRPSTRRSAMRPPARADRTPFRTRADERIPFVRYDDGRGGRHASSCRTTQLRLPAGAGRRGRPAGRLRRVHRVVPVADQRRRGDRRVPDGEPAPRRWRRPPGRRRSTRPAGGCRT